MCDFMFSTTCRAKEIQRKFHTFEDKTRANEVIRT